MKQESRIISYGLRKRRVIFATTSFFIFYFLFLILSSSSVYAVEGLTVTPAIIDEKAYARDILKQDITFTNGSARKMTLYLSVNNIDSQEGKMKFVDYQNADRNTSLANWIEVSRGVIEVGPGETRTIPLEIRVNMGALGGEYHAAISIGEGSTRAEAEANPLRASTVLINLEVLENIHEKLDLKKFASDKIFFLSPPITFSYVLENVGNRALTPSGEIIVYDRRGNEVTSMPINGKSIEPNSTVNLASAWNGNTRMGRYKAYLSLEYGDTNKGSITDTTFFWVIPLPFLIGISGAFAVLAGSLAWFIHFQYEKKYHHLHELARAHASLGSEKTSTTPTPAAKPVIFTIKNDGDIGKDAPKKISASADQPSAGPKISDIRHGKQIRP